MGLGFSLGAQDKGLGSAIKDTSSGLMDISKSVIGIGLASAKMIFKPPNFGPTIGLVQQLAGDVKLNTTAMEAYGVAANKVTSAGLAGLNMTEKEFKRAQGKIAGIAFGMNVPVENVTKSFTALKQASVDVTQVGFKSLKQFQQVMEVTGASGEDMAAAMGTMKSQMGMNNAQIKNAITGVAALGKKMNIGRLAVSGMAETVKTLNANSNLLPQNWSPARMDKFLKGTTVVAGALTGIGMKSEEAMAASQALTRKLLEGEKGMAKMYSGLQDDLPDVADILTQNLGTADDAFKMLAESPDQFLKKMGNVVGKVNKMNLKPDQMNRFRLQMESTFGPEVMAAFKKDGFGKMGQIIDSAQGPIKDQDKVLEDLAKRHKDGRIYAERFGIAQDIIQTKLKKVNGVMSDSKYLKTYVRQGKDFTNWASVTAAKGGPLSKLTTSLIEVKNRGFGGFLASHSKFGFAMAEGIQMMQPMMQYIPAITGAFKALASPIGIVVGAITGLYFAVKDLNKGEASILRPMIKKFMNDVPELLSKLGKMAREAFDAIFKVLKSVDWGKVFDTVSEGFTMVFNAIWSVLDAIDWNRVGQVLGDIFSKAAEIALIGLQKALDFFGKIVFWLSEVDWGAVGKKLGGFLGEAAVIAGEFVWKALSNFPKIMIKIFEKLGDFLMGALDGVRDYLMKKFPDAAKPIIYIFAAIKAAVMTVITVIKTTLSVIQSVGSAVSSFFSSGSSSMGSFAEDMTATINQGKVSANEFLSETAKNVQKTLMEGAKLRADAVVARADAEDKALAASGGRSKAWIKTVDGEVVKSTQAFVRYEKSATGAIEEVARSTARFMKGTVSGAVADGLKQAAKDLYQFRSTQVEINKNMTDEEADATNAALDQHVKFANKKFMEEFGIRKEFAIQARKSLEDQFAISNELTDDAKKKGEGYYKALMGFQDALTANATGVRMEMARLETQGLKNTDQYRALETKFKEMGVAGVEMVGKYKQIMSGQSDLLFKDLAGANKAALDALATAGKEGTAEYMALADKVRERTKMAEVAARMLGAAYQEGLSKTLSGIPVEAEKTLSVATDMFEQIATAREADLADFMANTTLEGDAYNAELARRMGLYDVQSDEIKKILARDSDALLIGVEKTTLDSLGKVQVGLTKMTDEVAMKTKENATEIQKQFGVSSEAALESVNQIAAVDPKIFKANMTAVKKYFMEFLGAMDKEGKKLMDNTTKSFNALWKTMDEGWKKNSQLMTDFGLGAEKVIVAFWNTVILKSSLAGLEIIKIAASVQTSLSAMAKSINMMDLLASPDQITMWAASVVSALSTAFRTGSAADSLIGTFYEKALTRSGELRNMASPATPAAGGAGSTASSSSVTADQNILRTINSPKWTEETGYIPQQLKQMNANLSETLKQLAAISGNRVANHGKVSESPKVKPKR